MLNSKQDDAWKGYGQAQREMPWHWHGGMVEGGRVRDRVLRWWHARGSGLDDPASRDSDLEQILQCAECGERFRGPPGTVRCMSCCDEEW